MIVESEARRKQLIAKVKIAQKQLGLDDETYRDMLHSVTGKRSAAQLKVWELDNVIKCMVSKGFKPKKTTASKNNKHNSDAQSNKIKSLWIELHEAGKVRDPSNNALRIFAKNQLKMSSGIEAIQWLNSKQKSLLIEILKRWLLR